MANIITAKTKIVKLVDAHAFRRFRHLTNLAYLCRYEGWYTTTIRTARRQYGVTLKEYPTRVDPQGERDEMENAYCVFGNIFADEALDFGSSLFSTNS